MNALSPHDPCQEVVCKFSAQSGKTEILLNFLGYIIDQDPGPCLVIQPTEKPMGMAFSKDRIAPMLRDTPALKGKVAQGKGRNTNNTLLHKTFAGGWLAVAGSNSASGLASRPCRYVLFDEVDRFETTKEGHAIPLATKRTRTFHNRKILKVSTPTIDGTGIDSEYQSCDERWEWHLTCPDCGESQQPAFKRFRFDSTDAHTVRYVCSHCGVEHDRHKEQRIKARGEWVLMYSSGGPARKKGYWFNQFGSPFASWVETIQEFLDARGDAERLKVVVNTAFAETWKDQGEQPDHLKLMDRAEDYGAQVPSDVLLLTAGVDVQQDRLELEVFGWGDGEECYPIEHWELYGDPQKRDVWQELDELLLDKYRVADGRDLGVTACCIDAGYLPDFVYDFVIPRQGRKVFAVKGHDEQGKPIVMAPTKRKAPRGGRQVQLFMVGTDTAKTVIYSRLKQVESGPGYIHFPLHYDEEYFLQLTAETCVTKYYRGFPKREWRKTRPRNEALDRMVYGLAALKIANPRWEILRKRAERLVQRAEPTPEPTKPVRSKPTNRKRPRRSGAISKYLG